MDRMIAAMNEKSPSANGHSQKGNTAETAASKGHFDDTTSAALRQEFMEILSQLPQEDVEEITQRMRDMIKGRA